MTDYIYKPEDVDETTRSIFDQLTHAFGDNYEIWRRVDDFGRRIIAAVVHPEGHVNATVEVRRAVGSERAALTTREVEIIRHHLARNGAGDLAL